MELNIGNEGKKDEQPKIPPHIIEGLNRLLGRRGKDECRQVGELLNEAKGHFANCYAFEAWVEDEYHLSKSWAWKCVRLFLFWDKAQEAASKAGLEWEAISVTKALDGIASKRLPEENGLPPVVKGEKVKTARKNSRNRDKEIKKERALRKAIEADFRELLQKYPALDRRINVSWVDAEADLTVKAIGKTPKLLLPFGLIQAK